MGRAAQPFAAPERTIKQVWHTTKAGRVYLYEVTTLSVIWTLRTGSLCAAYGREIDRRHRW